MYDNWTEVRQQMDEVLELERQQRRARRQQQPSWVQSVRKCGQELLSFVQRQPQHSIDNSFHVSS